MAPTPPIRLLTAAYIDMLTTVTGRPWHDTTVNDPTEKPYGIVQHIPGGSRSGDIGRPVGMAIVVYQLTAVGVRADQADALLDRALDATFALNTTGYVNAITAAGLTVIARDVDMDGGTETDGALVNAINRIALTVHATT